jgi:hypothetical protein
MVFTAFTAVPLLPAGVAQAEGQFIGGAVCKPQFGTPYYDNIAEVLNVGATTMHVVCPVDRTPFGGAGYTAAGLYVTDLSNTADVGCAVNSKNPGGSSVTWGTGSSSYTGTNLWISMVTPHTTYSDYIWVSCDVPAATSLGLSGIQSFMTVEE